MAIRPYIETAPHLGGFGDTPPACRGGFETRPYRLSDDVAAVFPDAQSVNDALRSLIRVAQRTVGKPPRRRRTPKSLSA